MKKISFILVLLFAVGMTYGQSRTDLKGPAAKNYKTWKQQSNSTLVHTDTKQLKGPQAKNQRTWKSDENAEGVYLASTNRRHLKGPKAKNCREHVYSVTPVQSRLVIVEDKNQRSIEVR